MIRYYVRARQHGYVLVDRANNAIVTPILEQQEAWLEVWERNGRQGATPALARTHTLPRGEAA